MSINVNVWSNLLNNLTGSYEEFYAQLGQDINLYQFDIVSGFINVSERGENEITSNADNDRTNIKVQTSNEPIVAYWEGSYQGTEDPQFKNRTKKNFKVGKYYKTKLTSINVTLEQGTIQWNENDYNSFAVNRTINLFVPKEDFNNVELSKKLFLILNKRAKSHQWLKITSAIPIYNPNDENKLIGTQLTLMNLNLQFSKSGRDILTFVQMAQPGGNYAFPKEVQVLGGTDIVVQLDSQYLYGIPGVTNTQLEFTSGVGLSDIVLFGRQKDNNYVFPSKRLLLYKPFLPKSSYLNVVGSATNNYLSVFGAKVVSDELWQNWKEKLSELFNFVADKTFNGGLDVKSWDEVFKSNPVSPVSGQYTYSSFSNWLVEETNDLVYSCDENPYIVNVFNMKNCGKMTIADFFNHNGFLFQTTQYLPTNYRETTRWSFKDIPLIGGAIGGAINYIIGFDPAWQKSINWVPGKPINMVIPCETAQMSRKVLGGTSQYLPMDCLSNDNNRFKATGNYSQIMSFNFSLTDRFKTTNSAYIINGNPEGKGGNGIWDTIYLGMFKDEEGNQLFPDGKYLEWHEQCKAYEPADKNQTYEVDNIFFQVYGKCNFRLTFYNNNGSDTNLTSLYETRAKLNSSALGDGCLWTNQYQLNFLNRENTDYVPPYPTHIDPPSPNGKIIELQEFKEKRLFLPKVWNLNVETLFETGYQYPVATNKSKSQFQFSNSMDETNKLGSDVTYQSQLSDYGIPDLQHLKDNFIQIEVEVAWEYNDGSYHGKTIVIPTNTLQIDDIQNRELINDGTYDSINYQLFNSLTYYNNEPAQPLDAYFRPNDPTIGKYLLINYGINIWIYFIPVGARNNFRFVITNDNYLRFNFLGNLDFLGYEVDKNSGTKNKVIEFFKTKNNQQNYNIYNNHLIRSVKLIPKENVSGQN